MTARRPPQAQAHDPGRPAGIPRRIVVVRLGGLVLGVVLGVRTAERVGAKATISGGLGLLAAGAAMSLGVQLGTGYGATAAWLTVFGAGFGAVLIASQNLALNALDPERAGAGGGLTQVMRQTGSVIGIAVFVSLLNGVYRHSVDVQGLPPDAAAAVRDSFQAGLGVARQAGNPELATSVQDAFVAGMHAQAWLSVAVSVAVSAVALGVVLVVMPRRLGRAESAVPPVHDAVPSGG